MAEYLGLISRSMKPKISQRLYFTQEGNVALILLKIYTYLNTPKLLWDGIEKLYVIMCTLNAKLILHRPRTKYVDVENANLSYRKHCRPPKVQTRKLNKILCIFFGIRTVNIVKLVRRTAGEIVQSALRHMWNRPTQEGFAPVVTEN